MIKLVEKYFIKTSNPTYTIGDNKVVCTIHTVLACRFSNGMVASLEAYTSDGVAKCAKEDKFNIETGIKLATVRAENKYHKHYMKSFARMTEILEAAKVATDNITADCECQIIHNNAYVDKLLSE